jgi:glycosyltransferase involved in cell wall biosynthesis
MKPPQVSVVIPCFNRALLIGDTVENMLMQTLAPHEVIAVDDGSTDGSVETLRGFGNRIRLIQQPNSGPATARNAGFAASTGEFIQFMDSDDLASLNKLEVQANALLASGAELAYGPWIHLRIDGRRVTALGHVLQSKPPSARLPLHEWHLRGWALTLQNCLFRRDLITRIGRLREDLIGTEDTEYLNRIFMASPRVVFTPSCLLLYRLHDTNKLTGGGTTNLHKAAHLSRAWGYMAENVRTAASPVGPVTRFIFSYWAHQWTREQVRLSETPSRGGRNLLGSFGARASLAFWLYGVWCRLGSAVRQRITGSHWPRVFQGRAPNEADIRQILAAGYDVPREWRRSTL